jgi:hypothetical protein
LALTLNSLWEGCRGAHRNAGPKAEQNLPIASGRLTGLVPRDGYRLTGLWQEPSHQALWLHQMSGMLTGNGGRETFLLIVVSGSPLPRPWRNSLGESEGTRKPGGLCYLQINFRSEFSRAKQHEQWEPWLSFITYKSREINEVTQQQMPG